MPKYVRSVHLDPWDHDYRFTQDGGTAEIRSARRNGRYGDEDDIVVDVDSGKLR